MIFIHWFHYFYIPLHGAWYTGNVWGNVFVAPIIVIIGFVWSKTRFWPLRPFSHILEHVKYHNRMLEELHHLTHTGEVHPRVQARLDRGELSHGKAPPR